MRTLVLLRGIPASGKTTWIKKHWLENYTLSHDLFKRIYEGPVLGTDGQMHTSERNNKEVWKILNHIAEQRMTRGEFLVIDATNITMKDINKYRSLAKTYRYRIIGVDFTDVSLEEALKRNRNRSEMERVPDAAIVKFHNRLQQPFHVNFPFIKPDEFDSIMLKPLNLSHYKKIHHIGDIHGCYDALCKYLGDGLKEDEYYIFHGDYLDRGLENIKTLKLMMELSKKENVLLLEGNHERWLHLWAHNQHTQSKEFEEHTSKELDAAGISKKEVRIFYRKLAQCAYYCYKDKVIFGCHGGVSTFPGNPIFLSAEQMIHGVGDYQDVKKVEEMFDESVPNHIYQIHGHRNFGYPVHSTERNYNLEGKVELGGCLRIVTVSNSGIETIEIKNDVYRKKEENFLTVHNAIETLRKDSYIKEKKFGSISSFNFSREAFNNQVWNERTVKARGLYLNTKEEELVCRGYDKFFAVDKVEETKYDNLKNKLKFPVQAYIKENGFLGLITLNKETNDLFITTKSDPTGNSAIWLREMFYEKTSKEGRKKLKEYLSTHNETLVFECVDQIHDPHIIEYENSNLYLLDVIKNEFELSKMPYPKLQEFADEFGFKPKKLAFSFSNFEEFDKWYHELMELDKDGKYTYQENHIEGFVFEDTNLFMFKLKLNYYKKWKQRRTLLSNIDSVNPYKLNTEEQKFIKSVKEMIRDSLIKKDDLEKGICNIRRLYECRYNEN